VTGAGLRGLRALVNRSFLSLGSDNRYQIHELLRQYGAERLEASGEADRTRDAHTGFVVEALSRLGADLRGGRPMDALDEIETEFENVRAAWDWALHRGDVEAIRRSMGALEVFAWVLNRYEELAELLRLARDRLEPPPGRRPSPVRARILASLAYLEMMSTSGSEGTAADLDESLAIANDHGDRRESAVSLMMTGFYQFVERREFERARMFFEQGLELFRGLDEPFYVAIGLLWFGDCIGSATDLATHVRYSLQALDESRATGNVLATSMLLVNLASVTRLSGDYAGAERFCEEALALLGAMKLRAGFADALVQLGLVRLLRGDLAGARSLADEALAVAREVDNPWIIAPALAVLALEAAISGDPRSADQLGKECLGMSSGFAFYEGAVLGGWALAVAQFDLADYSAARRHLVAALAPARERGLTALLLWPLGVAPVVLAAEGERVRAVELMGLIFGHPLSATGWLEAWPRLTTLRAELRAELGPDAFSAAWERGAALDPETVAAALEADPVSAVPRASNDEG
jgi:tetratricopeptide (TPR) repeat protein